MSARRGPIKAWAQSHWPLIRTAGIAIFVIVVLILLGVAISKIEWTKVWGAIQKLPGSVIALAGLIALLSYMVYSTFDLLGKWYTGHPMAWWRTLVIGFISYAFTMNLGAPVGGLGLRMRLYAKQGIGQGVVMRVLALSLATNWVGYLLLAGCLFALGEIRLPSGWALNEGPFRLIGAVMALAGIAYLLLCAFSRKRSWTIRGHEIELPSIGLALIQVTLAILNWGLIGAVIYILLQGQAGYFEVTGILMISAIAGAIVHIPGGLGVIESVFIALLDGDLPRSQVLGALLVYRAIYYLAPLLISAFGYVGAEAKMEVPDEAKA
jgi:uncharacterized membrane protein YbhN (UPF0104 family)